MNYFVEGLQGSGKSTLAQKLARKHPEMTAVREGDYSPVELAWCAWVSEAEYRAILERYAVIRPLIEEKTHREGDRRIICYTQVRTDVPGFYQDLEQYEIYNSRRPSAADFRDIVLTRYRNWRGDGMIFECSLFQNIVEDMLLFQNADDDEVLRFYRSVREALDGQAYRILYLETRDVAASLGVIRRERSDAQGNELWFPMLLGYFNASPYARSRGVSGEAALLTHLEHRQALELRLCRELFPRETTVLVSKQYEI